MEDFQANISEHSRNLICSPLCDELNVLRVTERPCHVLGCCAGFSPRRDEFGTRSGRVGLCGGQTDKA
jgi:hypothetical protein